MMLSAEEKELLLVMKNNQKREGEIEQKLRSLRVSLEEMQEENDDDEDEKFISSIERSLGIKHYDETYDVDDEKRIRPFVPEKDWNTLVSEAAHNGCDNVGFGDVLTPEEIQDAYRRTREIDEAFERKTGLRKTDIAFMGTALALQCVRQYVVDPWLKNRRKGSTKNDESGEKKHADKGWYYVPTENIMINRVPFDAQNYNHSNDETIAGFLKGAKDHRYVTLGHDPLLGWIFGTANILTSTLTRYDLKSAHVKYDPISKQNVIHSRANNARIADAVIDRWNSGLKDGKLAVVLALFREGKHLYSDLRTTDSIPIPGIMTGISPAFAEELLSYGIDTASVGTEVSLSILINWLIAVLHRLSFTDNSDDKKANEVRTRKVLLYSNFIASSSNIIASYISKNLKLLDVGGILVTITRIISDVGFICKVKDEFVQYELDTQFNGIVDEIDTIYNARFNPSTE